jgi:NFU1 iron-sulfur cluster scaffold homolog, mitochondrial
MFTLRKLATNRIARVALSPTLSSQLPRAWTSARSLFIQTQTTPNENALKFVPNGATILPDPSTPTVEITGIKDAIHKSELAMKLLSMNDKAISSILFGFDFITIVKYAEDSQQSNENIRPQSWNVLKPQIFALLTEHLTMGQPVISPEYFSHLEKLTASSSSSTSSSSNSASAESEFDEDLTPEEEVVALIKELLTTRIQPAIQEDGGDIQFIRFDHDSGIVYLKLIGACKSCSSSEITLKSGIEDMLKYYIDEVKSVQQVLDEPTPEEIVTSPSTSIPKFEKHTIDELPPAL